jgi:hypothetical protein
VLDVAGSSEVGGEELLLVGHPVVVRVGELPHLVRVRLHRQHAVGAEGHDETREDELVDEDGVALVDAVVVRVLVARDAADRVELARGVGVLHVAAQLEHEHAAVAIERDRAGLFDVRFGEDRRDAVAGLENELLLLFCGGERKDGGLLHEVGVGVGLVGGSWTACAPAAASLIGAGLTGRRCGGDRRLLWRRRLRLHDEGESADISDHAKGKSRPHASSSNQAPISFHRALASGSPRTPDFTVVKAGQTGA